MNPFTFLQLLTASLRDLTAPVSLTTASQTRLFKAGNPFVYLRVGSIDVPSDNVYCGKQRIRVIATLVNPNNDEGATEVLWDLYASFAGIFASWQPEGRNSSELELKGWTVASGFLNSSTGNFPYADGLGGEAIEVYFDADYSPADV